VPASQQAGKHQSRSARKAEKDSAPPRKKKGKGGFKQAVENVMKGGKYDKESASAIVASASRNASPAAKRRNPNLKKVL
jgi:hypothetical protein